MSNEKNNLWEYASSVKLALTLIFALAATSIIGTVLPQNEAYELYVQKFGTSGTKIIGLFDLNNMYHSWWFTSLLILFGLNLTACSLKRLPPVIGQLRNPKNFLTDEMEKSLSCVQVITKTGEPGDWAGAVRRYLETKGAVSEDKTSGGVSLYLEKGRFSRLGVYITHLSILLILLGGMAGAIFGFRSMVNIPEGSSVDSVPINQTRPPHMMGFAIRCDKFALSYYPNGMVKEYRSDVTILENGKEVKKDYLIVNRPLTYKNLTFYQSSYGAAERRAMVRVRVIAGNDAGKQYEMQLTENPSPIPNSQDSVQIASHMPNLQDHGPALLLHMEEGGRCGEVPALKNYPFARTNPNSKYVFAYSDYSEKLYTGLQVTKDPGVWVVWTGCLLMMVGLYFCLFVRQRRIWAKITGGNNTTTITIAGQALRVKDFDEEFKKITEDLETITVGEA
jgi:cytochrome c biogenesis protein